ncbi:hypothetical protein BN975_02460 [Mycolicibacterium farcinogenes]|uniref:Uncharacterized protein n=1 Tax=Mycolicibacterium senegalense TaxID=1796 RepID=A0A378W688_9MYCO|nr:hypothetical protein BN975_02460 [Mycolicibacterium farcinogenes]SUA28104.1 Uncharacterised protein [Mycolicibacterium senegalense]
MFKTHILAMQIKPGQLLTPISTLGSPTRANRRRDVENHAIRFPPPRPLR